MTLLIAILIVQFVVIMFLAGFIWWILKPDYEDDGNEEK